MRNENHMRSTEEFMMSTTEKHVLVRKTFTNKRNVGLPRRSCIKKTLHGVKVPRLTDKEKVPRAALSKEGLVISWNIKHPITINFQKKKEPIINSATFGQFLRQSSIIK